MPLSLHVDPTLHIEAMSGVQHMLMSVTLAQNQHMIIFNYSIFIALLVSMCQCHVRVHVDVS